MSKADDLRAMRERRLGSGVLGRPPQPTRETKPKRGPPRIEDRGKTLTATKPWGAAGMSRATWYRRQAENRKNG